MSFLDIDRNNVQEPKIVDAGKEYKVRIVGFVTEDVVGTDHAVRRDKNDNRYFLPILEFVDEPFAKTMTKYYPLPEEHMRDKDQNGNIYGITLFESAFSLEPEVWDAQANFADAVGSEAWAIVGVKTNKQSGEEENFVKKFVMGA